MGFRLDKNWKYTGVHSPSEARRSPVGAFTPEQYEKMRLENPKAWAASEAEIFELPNSPGRLYRPERFRGMWKLVSADGGGGRVPKELEMPFTSLALLKAAVERAGGHPKRVPLPRHPFS